MLVKELEGGRLEILSRDEIERIHAATLEVLRRVGIKVWEPTAFRLFREAGADADARTLMVRISEQLLRETIRKAPAEFEMYGREPRYRLRYGGNRVHFSVGGLATQVQDLEGKVRLATLQDVENLARIADSCEHLHHVSMMTTPSDVPVDVYHLHTLWADWKNSVKPTDGFSWTGRKTQEVLDMAAILRGGPEELVKKPLLLGFTNPVSPLQLSKELIEGAILFAKYRQPMLYAPEALAGATAPATLAGLLVQQNAEVLAGIMVSELVEPGTPVLYGTVSAALDMRTGAPALGGPEVALFNLATAQLARYYGLPSRGTGGNTDAKLVDVQAGLETTMSLLSAALAGMNFIYDSAGVLDGSLTASYEKLVIDNEICGMVSRILAGIEITDETLAVDEIVRVGPSAGFLGSPFTVKMFRKEHFLPAILDRKSREAWVQAGGRDLATVAREKAKAILQEHTPEPIDRGVAADIERFIKDATKGYGL